MQEVALRHTYDADSCVDACLDACVESFSKGSSGHSGSGSREMDTKLC